VYAVEDIECGDIVDLNLSESYIDGEFYAFYDPRGFGVYRLPVAEVLDLSSVTLNVSGADYHYLGLSMPNPEWLRFYGGAERLYEQISVLSLDVDPSTYPALGDYLDPLVGELFFSVGSLDAGPGRLVVEVECSSAPRPDFAALPVIQPLTVTSFQLDAIGGTEPYTWSAIGLPSGIKLAADGELSGQTGAVGTYEVDVTVADKTGGSTTEQYTLYVGNDEACAGYQQMTCGDSIDGEFQLPYFSDGSGEASTAVMCVVHTTDTDLAFEVYSDDGELRLDIADPGRSADDMFDRNKGTYIDYAGEDSLVGVGVDPFSWPNIEDYDNLPVLLALRAYEPGGWTVHLTCP
jgi:Putative Ig domain